MLYKNHITAENMFPELHHVPKKLPKNHITAENMFPAPKKLSANQISWFFNTLFAELLALLASFVSMLVWYLIFVPVIWRNLLCLPMRVSVSLFKISLRIGLLHFFVKQRLVNTKFGSAGLPGEICNLSLVEWQ